MPTARHPLIFASCPTIDPTAPDAAETTTVSPGFRLADVEQADDTRSCPACRGRRCAVEIGDRLRIELAQILAVRRGVLPASRRSRRRRHRRWNAGLRDSTTSLTVWPHMTSPIVHRRGVRRRVAHPAAHVRIERQVDRAPQHVAVAGGRHRQFASLEVVERSASRRGATSGGFGDSSCDHRQRPDRLDDSTRFASQLPDVLVSRLTDYADPNCPSPAAGSAVDRRRRADSP